MNVPCKMVSSQHTRVHCRSQCDITLSPEYWHLYWTKTKIYCLKIGQFSRKNARRLDTAADSRFCR